jgi:hypothetical protein
MKTKILFLMAAVGAMLASVAHAAHDALFKYMGATGMVSFLLTKAPAFTGVLPIRVQPVDQSVQYVPVPFDFPAANPTVADIHALVKVPAGVEIVDWYIQTEDADTNGAPTLAFTLGSLNAGLTDITTAYKTAISVGTNAGMQRADSAAAFVESSAAERTIGLKYTAVAATYAAGKKGVLVLAVRG